MFLDHFFCHESDTLSPVLLLWRLNVYGQVEVEIVSIILCHFLELILQKNIIDSPISENHFMVCLVFIPKSRLKHMVARRNSSSTSNVADLGLLILEFSLQDVEVSPSFVL